MFSDAVPLGSILQICSSPVYKDHTALSIERHPVDLERSQTTAGSRDSGARALVGTHYCTKRHVSCDEERLDFDRLLPLASSEGFDEIKPQSRTGVYEFPWKTIYWFLEPCTKTSSKGATDATPL